MKLKQGTEQSAGIKGPWQRLGFRDTPYSREPLAPTAEDAILHIGREQQAARFLALADCPSGCTMIVSGAGGLGKTSFLNVLQHKIRTGEATISKRLVPCYKMTTAEAGTSATELARRITDNFVQSLVREARLNKMKVPAEIRKIEEWLSHEPSVSGRSFNLQIFGNGGGIEQAFEIPSVSEATLETWREILTLLATSSNRVGKFDGAFICIDNAETLSVEDLTSLLMAYRDTLFQIPRIWWIVIGQSNLFVQIERVNSRVSQRVRGGGIEIPPLESDELHLLIERRVKALGTSEAKSPFSEIVHDLLMQASCGQPRYVLAAADDLFSDFIAMLVAQVDEDGGSAGAPALEFREKMMNAALQSALKDRQIDDEIVLSFLENGVRDRMKARKLRVQDLVVLQTIAESDYIEVAVREVSINGGEQEDILQTLRGLESADLLHAIEVKGELFFQLKGDAWLCARFKLWNDIRMPVRKKKSSETQKSLTRKSPPQKG